MSRLRAGLTTPSPSTTLGRVGNRGLFRCLDWGGTLPKQPFDGAAPGGRFPLDLLERGGGPLGEVALASLGLHVELHSLADGVRQAQPARCSSPRSAT